MENPQNFIKRMRTLYVDTRNAIVELMKEKGVTEVFIFDKDDFISYNLTMYNLLTNESFDIIVTKVELEEGKYLVIHDDEGNTFSCSDLNSKGEIIWLYEYIYDKLN